MIVVGGSYTEICFEPIWENIYGSGFRAVQLILQNSEISEVEFYTYADAEIKNHLKYFTNTNERLKVKCWDIDKSPEFHYDHPLKTPTIFPRPDLFNLNLNKEAINGDNILIYGFIEGSVVTNGNNVVYDPQSPANPKFYSQNGSTANSLVYIINLSEAKKLTGKNDVEEIKDFLFEKENLSALVIKMGAKGANVYENKNDAPINIPVYITKNVWPIGSGDVFSAYFALKWFEGNNVKESASIASKATAIYCNSKSLTILPKFNDFDFKSLIIKNRPEGQIYLAGPFFTFAERWLINELWVIFKNMKLNIFSPFHDVGHGKAEDVVGKDLEGLDNSKVVFAVIDGLDSGTLFEVGYAVSKNIKVIAFVQNEGEESLKMLEGTNCIIERDLTTAVYKLYWILANE